MKESLGILWRGPLDSCNYDCDYCPFAKRQSSKAMLEKDRLALERFVAWVQKTTHRRLQILFTPYGEALIWPWYQEAMVVLSKLEHVEQVTIQTNGSGSFAFAERVDLSRFSLWVTYHPTQVAREKFVNGVASLTNMGVVLSVGMVVTPNGVAEAEQLRQSLPRAIPMWLNAERPGPQPTAEDNERLLAIDSMFGLETRRHPSRGKPCFAGEDTISVAGDGTITRCHFVEERLGNLYTDDLEALLRPRLCTRATCDCFIGYLHLKELAARENYPRTARLARVRGPLAEKFPPSQDLSTVSTEIWSDVQEHIGSEECL